MDLGSAACYWLWIIDNALCSPTKLHTGSVAPTLDGVGVNTWWRVHNREWRMVLWSTSVGNCYPWWGYHAGSLYFIEHARVRPFSPKLHGLFSFRKHNTIKNKFKNQLIIKCKLFWELDGVFCEVFSSNYFRWLLSEWRIIRCGGRL